MKNEITLDHLIQHLARNIVATRDFCGDEKAAAGDAAYDYGITLTKSLWQQALSAANSDWKNFQIAAGVSCPIDAAERKSIYNIMNRAE